MKIKCSSCNRLYDIPDERLPFGEKISFPCPACKAIIDIDLRSEKANSSSPPFHLQAEKTKNDATGTEDKNFLIGEALQKKILRNLKDLPAMPQVMFKAREVMNDPNSSSKALADILETDQALATRVLRLANSAYYGLAGKVTSVQHASVLLGYNTLGEIVTLAGASSLLGNKLEGYKLDSGELWKHSLAVAFASREIAGRVRPELDNDAFSTGLIHDAGKIVLDPYVLERNEEFEDVMSGSQETFLSAEKKILGFDHSEIASEMCKSWKIPSSLANAIRYHHHPSRSQENELAYIVHIADSIAMMSGIGAGIDGMNYIIDDKAMDFLKLKEEDLAVILEETVESVDKIAEKMGTQ